MSADIFTVPGSTNGERPAVIAHRGSGPGRGPSGYLENTFGSLRWAVDLGADWVECDVQLSADGDLILTHNVIHDGRAIRQMTTEELLSSGFDTLDDAHARLPLHVGLDLDIKISMYDVPGRSPDLFGRVAEWASSAGGERPIVLVSFCPTLPAVAADVPLGWMTNPGAWYYESVVSAVRMGASVCGAHADDIITPPPGCPSSEEVAAFAREHGMAIKAWGVTPANVEALHAGGVTGLCGDDVAGIAAAVRKLADSAGGSDTIDGRLVS